MIDGFRSGLLFGPEFFCGDQSGAGVKADNPH
jgi:hypothetical protein